MLKLNLDSLDAVDEPYRALYEQDGDKYRLKVDDLPDVSGLRTALDKERKAARELEKKVKRWEALGKSDEEIAEMLSAAEEADRKRAEESGDHGKILKQHQDKWAKEREALESELRAAKASERSAIIETSVTASLTKAGATEEGLDLLPERLAGRINFETVDGKRVIKVMQADGETPMAGNGPGGLATIDDLIKEATSKWPSLFKGSGASGTGKPPHSGGGSKPDLSGLSPVEKINLHRAGKL